MMKNLHPNIHPDSVPLKEICKWAEDHDDPWVQRLAKITYELVDVAPDITDVPSLIRDYDAEIYDFENEIESLREEISDLTTELDTAIKKIGSLKYDLEHKLDNNIQQDRIISLKSEVQYTKERLSEMTENCQIKDKRYADLFEQHSQLKEKYNVWQVIST